MNKNELTQAGFIPADWIPSDTRYLEGQLLVRMSERGILRLFIPTRNAEVELSSGTLYEPVVHYVGALDGLAAVLEKLL
ncbi:hypothetical protein [Solirubrum puertoriconensis]|uniref:Uncharacterized protein n=1 Tax=Solirubrum puertoriconensis TaxID=1751427 RepID=A0A9X0L6D0_SOLP1|nr:hypothetical protein [Solirubrum puertoriconensis]KUG09729.1 hypothetical protein ASU33_18780 [Solirubrum puertoriconensis]